MTTKYHIWTIGCQMNMADSERLGAALEQLGCTSTEALDEADIIVLNSCVVRQGAEDKVASKLGTLRPIKQEKPERIIALMGCMVGPDTTTLRRRFPFTDCFMRPQEFGALLQMVEARAGTCLDNTLPLVPATPSVASYLPIIHGCDKFCTFCIIPYRRGRERSRPIDELVREVEALVKRGVKEVTLLGQNVDSYGHDVPGRPDLADLLEAIDGVQGLKRLRFLTSHPNDMSQRIIEAVARLEKVCEYINLPVQAGDNRVLASMRRGYTREQYLELIDRIGTAIPGVGITTDLIVGFPGEDATAFEQSVDLIERVRFDKVHVAMYSERPGTSAYRKLADDVPETEKKRRLLVIEAVQARILAEENAKLVGSTHEVLLERRDGERWSGRTRSNKLVYVDGSEYSFGELVQVKITDATAWSLRGEAPARRGLSLAMVGLGRQI